MTFKDKQTHLIPEDSDVYQRLKALLLNSGVVAFTGLPGVGKSLYINQFYLLAKAHHRDITVIQWDMARKAFETPPIARRFPMRDGEIHNGVKLAIGRWLLDVIKKWLAEKTGNQKIMLIEAPLVGHRFIELAKPNEDPQLEAYLSSDRFKIALPVPSKKVRAGIEAARRRELSDEATTWMGAKPAVMLRLWKSVCGIANEFGHPISMDRQPPYDPEVYAFVFERILRHRHCVAIPVDEVFEVKLSSEKDLHFSESLAADAQTAQYYADLVAKKYPTDRQMEEIVRDWYKTDLQQPYS